MVVALTLPSIDQDGASARRIRWRKRPGDRVSPHEPVAVLVGRSSYLAVRLKAPATLVSQLVEEDVELRAGDRFAEIEPSGPERANSIIELARADVLTVEAEPLAAKPEVDYGRAAAGDRPPPETHGAAALSGHERTQSCRDDNVISRMVALVALMVATLSVAAQLFLDSSAPLFVGSIALLVMLATFPSRRRGRHAR